jgi:hypothetical protein
MQGDQYLKCFGQAIKCCFNCSLLLMILFLNSEMNKFCPIEMGRRSEDEQKCGLNLNNTTKLSLTVIRRASSFSDFGGLFLKSLEVNRKLLLSCSQCNVLCNDQHMLVHGQTRGSCQIFIRLSGRVYRGRGKLSVSEEMRLDPLFSLLTLPPLVKLLCVSYWSIFCNRIVVSVLTSSHSSVTITSHVSPWKEKSCSSHIWVRESYLWYPFLLFPSLYELTERNNFIFFKRDAIALPLQYDHASTNLYLLWIRPFTCTMSA